MSSSQFSFGRPPWYDPQVNNKPLIIGVTGGTASGKTTVCEEIVKRLGLPWLVLLSMDRFYKSLSEEEMSHPSDHNFDHPDAFDFDLFYSTIKELTTNKSCKVPKYSFVTHQREKDCDTFYGADVIIVEGILSLYSPDVRSLMDMKVYVHTDDDIRLARRIKRDIAERGRTLEDVLYQYQKTVKPAHDDFIAPTMRYADIIIPRGGDNYVAIDLLVQHIRLAMQKRGMQVQQANVGKQISGGSAAADGLISPAASSLSEASSPSSSAHKYVPSYPPNQFSVVTLPASSSPAVVSPSALLSSSAPSFPSSSVHVLPRTPSLLHLHSLLRSPSLQERDFQHHVHRLSRLLFSHVFHRLALSNCPASSASDGTYSVTTPTSSSFSIDAAACSLLHHSSPSPLRLSPSSSSSPPLPSPRPLVAVSIVRSGEPLEPTLRELAPSVPFGKIVIQQSAAKEEGPRLFYCKFPPRMAEEGTDVLLLDACIATGNVLLMALQVLRDHGVVGKGAKGRVFVACLTAAAQGVANVLAMFPEVQIVSTWMEDGVGLDDKMFLAQGMGPVGDRYFGTLSAAPTTATPSV